MKRINLIPLAVLHVTILTALACGNATEPVDVPPEVIDLTGRWRGYLTIRAWNITPPHGSGNSAGQYWGETICAIVMDLTMSGDQVFAGNYSIALGETKCGIVTVNDVMPQVMHITPDILPHIGSIRAGQVSTLARLETGASCVTRTRNGPDYRLCTYEFQFRIGLGSDANSQDPARCTVASRDGGPPPVELEFRSVALLVWGLRRSDVYDPTYPTLAGGARHYATCQERRISLQTSYRVERG